MKEKKQVKLLYKWLNDSLKKEQKHDIAAVYYTKWKRILDMPSIVVSGACGTIGLSTTGSNYSGAHAYSIFTLSVSAAIFSLVASYLNYSERAGKHSKCSYLYEKIARDIEVYIATREYTNITAYINLIKVNLNNYSDIEPPIPYWIEYHVENTHQDIIQTPETSTSSGDLQFTITDDDNSEEIDKNNSRVSSKHKRARTSSIDRRARTSSIDRRRIQSSPINVDNRNNYKTRSKTDELIILKNCSDVKKINDVLKDYNDVSISLHNSSSSSQNEEDNKNNIVIEMPDLDDNII